jgi:intracellular septation protein
MTEPANNSKMSELTPEVSPETIPEISPKPNPEPNPEPAIVLEPPAKTETAQWSKTLIDMGAPLVFAGVYFTTKDLLLATGVLIVTSIIAVIAAYVLEKRLAVMPLIAAGAAIIFGGLTLIFHDPSFIKIKVTIMNGLFGGVLLVGLAFKKVFLKMLMGEAIRLKDQAWKTLTLSYGLYFFAVALSNEIIWRTQSDAFWVTWRASLFFITIGFSIALAPFLMKNMITDEDKAPKS